MKIATILYTHVVDRLFFDTLDSVQTWMTNDIMVVLDGISTIIAKELGDIPVRHGHRHGSSHSTHVNMAFSIKEAYDCYPDADWYCFMEPDVLILDHAFKKDLDDNAWIMGCNRRHGKWDLPLLEEIVGVKIPTSCYFLGCIMFLNAKFVKKLFEIDFYNKFIKQVRGYESSYFPKYEGYSLQEEMFPSIANAIKPNSDIELKGYKYMCRWPKELEFKEFTAAVSIAHPLKNYDNPIRKHAREIRKIINDRPE